MNCLSFFHAMDRWLYHLRVKEKHIFCWKWQIPYKSHPNLKCYHWHINTQHKQTAHSKLFFVHWLDIGGKRWSWMPPFGGSSALSFTDRAQPVQSPTHTRIQNVSPVCEKTDTATYTHTYTLSTFHASYYCTDTVSTEGTLCVWLLHWQPTSLLSAPYNPDNTSNLIRACLRGTWSSETHKSTHSVTLSQQGDVVKRELTV